VEPAEREALEAEALRRLDEGAVDLAVTSIVRGYGPELLGFLVATLRDESAAEDVFSLVCERLLEHLPKFERRSSLRTWLYTVARHTAFRHRAQQRRRGAREVGFPAGSPLSAVAEEVRSQTAAHLRTEVKSRFAALRDTLSADDRALLILRVDKGMEWLDIATILAEARPEGAPPLDPKRESARLRKRFQTVKERLVELGKQEGLLP
jgi:RNA polymerase sigma-70 factor (ECF subfamily)